MPHNQEQSESDDWSGKEEGGSVGVILLLIKRGTQSRREEASRWRRKPMMKKHCVRSGEMV